MNKPKKNKSYLYILPLVIKSILEENPKANVDALVNNIINTYVFLKKDKVESKIILECLQTKKIDFLSKYSHLNEKIDIKDKTIYIINVDIFILSSYNKYIEGKYSTINRKDKSIILQFAWDYFDKKLFKNISEVLSRKKELKQSIEKKLDMKLPDGIELSSKINKKLETFII